MRKRLAHYSLLSLLSACFFFGVFHAVAEAQTSLPIDIGEAAASSPVIIPTATPFPTSTPEPTASPQPTAIPKPTAVPTPIPVVIISSPGDLEVLFAKYSDEYHVDRELMKRIARCESHFNPQADTGTYAGMFQFASQTWISTRQRMGMDPNPDLRKNAEESIRTNAFMLANGQQNAWRNCL